MDLKNTAGTMIKQINEALEKDANNNMRKIGLTVSQLSILLYITETNDKTLSLKGIEHEMHCAKSTAHGIVTRMERKGLIQRSENPDDHRVRDFTITDKGLAICDEAKKQMHATDLKLFSGMTDEEAQEFLRLLSKVRDAIV